MPDISCSFQPKCSTNQRQNHQDVSLTAIHPSIQEPQTLLPKSPVLSTTLTLLCPPIHHPPPIPHLRLPQLHRLHQIPHTPLFLHFLTSIPRAVVISRSAVAPTVVFRQANQTDDESGPVPDGDGGECAFVLAEFEGARFSFRRRLC